MAQSESGTEDQDIQEILERNLELETFLEQGGNLGINSTPIIDIFGHYKPNHIFP